MADKDCLTVESEEVIFCKCYISRKFDDCITVSVRIIPLTLVEITDTFGGEARISRKQ